MKILAIGDITSPGGVEHLVKNLWRVRKERTVDFCIVNGENGAWVEEQMEGWRDEMVRKTLIREAYSAKHLPRDPAKVDESFRHAMLMEERYAAIVAEAEIAANANAIPIEEAAELPASAVIPDLEPTADPAPVRKAADF